MTHFPFSLRALISSPKYFFPLLLLLNGNISVALAADPPNKLNKAIMQYGPNTFQITAHIDTAANGKTVYRYLINGGGGPPFQNNDWPGNRQGFRTPQEAVTAGQKYFRERANSVTRDYRASSQIGNSGLRGVADFGGAGNAAKGKLPTSASERQNRLLR